MWRWRKERAKYPIKPIKPIKVPHVWVPHRVEEVRKREVCL